MMKRRWKADRTAAASGIPDVETGGGSSENVQWEEVQSREQLLLRAADGGAGSDNGNGIDAGRHDANKASHQSRGVA